MRRLDRNNAILAVIDVQEKLAKVIHQIDEVQTNIERLIRGCHLLGVPMLVTEQYPKGLGATTTSIRAAIAETSGSEVIQKMCFSSASCGAFTSALQATGRKQVLLAGIEAHVCVYQTALDLLESGYEVYLVADAVSSRTADNRDLAIRRLESEGAKITSTEMALFEMTVEAGTDLFKSISKLVK